MTLFMNVVEAGSITKAADKLDISKSVVSQSLKQLEEELATTLLKRTTRRQSLTQTGEQFYKYCCEMHRLAEQAWEDMKIQQTVPKGKITLTAPNALMSSLVVPALLDTFSEFPDVELDLINDDSQLDLMENNIDLAIRAGNSAHSNYKQRRIGEFRDVLCCAVGNDSPMDEVPYVVHQWQPRLIAHQLYNPKTDETLSLTFSPQHRTNAMQTTLALIESGYGMGILPNFIVAANPTLKPVLPDFQMPRVNVYAIHPFHGNVPIGVKMAIAAIENALQDYTFPLQLSAV
ncbi:transcriptional regulator [Enterovibrio norvegicus]|uniref:DNA-binding transcriptional regulator, LysR family n=2 Tax=Enterovibrio norvegicus TaxID=188144 RepID=A0A1I5LYC6_9GAMM|nr:LysR family transcriptional regulator [Enterovibrio norvegicus]SFP02275.1 DNA-binding transcriptional regulator, LysR family [Enterovibrio norvegicus DSM 15893]OEF50929.1 transcriptional regulator [Enterovibrio norvegicus]OEF55810.1 transcriptional regulator [Enterovibrio norvegicus]PMH64922.1 transcriptional regulator [Enterovibrio norvegicus]PMI39177.1 transcriptional regulator [Enterovibrio norvegicus]